MPEPIIIPLDTPVVVPPSDEKHFDAMWITQVLVRTLLPTDQTEGGLVQIEYVPMNALTGETLPLVSQISTDQLMRAVQEVPEVAQAMGAILLAITPLKEWIDSQLNI
jgi:hypothetical protein